MKLKGKQVRKTEGGIKTEEERVLDHRLLGLMLF